MGYVITLVMIGMAIIHDEINNIWGLIIWTIIFPVLGTILLNRKLNRIEAKVEALFGFR